MMNTMTADEMRKTARGLGRYHRRMGMGREMAARAAVGAYPVLAGLEQEVRKGWNAERAGR